MKIVHSFKLKDKQILQCENINNEFLDKSLRFDFQTVKNASSDFYLALHKGKIVGYLAMKGQTYRVINQIAVDKDFQNKGVATELIQKCIKHSFILFKSKQIDSFCKYNNQPSIRMHYKNGFDLEDYDSDGMHFFSLNIQQHLQNFDNSKIKTK